MSCRPQRPRASPDASSIHLAKVYVSQGGAACAATTLLDWISGIQWPLLASPKCASTARSMQIGCTVPSQDNQLAMSPTLRCPEKITKAYFWSSTKGGAVGEGTSRHDNARCLTPSSNACVSAMTCLMPTKCCFLVVLDLPPCPTGRRPSPRHTCSSASSNSASTSWNVSIGINFLGTSSSSVASLNCLSTAKDLTPLWWLATRLVLSSVSNSWTCSSVIGWKHLMCHTQHGALPQCRCCNRRGRVW